MRLFGKKFIPGVRVEIEDDDEDEKLADKLDKIAIVEPAPVGNNGGVVVQSEDETSSSNEEDNDYERTTECFEAYTQLKKVKEPLKLKGTDWESVNYTLDKLTCEEDEVTGLSVSDKYIVVQYYIEGDIDVYDRETRKHLFRLSGHEYGGQCVQVSGSDLLLYSASMDCSLKCWNLEEKKLVDSVTDHCDYVHSIAVHSSDQSKGDVVATGGKGDREIFVYDVSEQGKLSKRHRLQGHKGWIIEILLLVEEDQLISGSEDATIRIWDLTTGQPIHVLEQDAGISCLMASQLPGRQHDLLLFGDKDGKMSYIDLNTLHVLHLLPNILIGTGKYCRSGRYHDKAVDTAYLTDNGYLITGSAGSKFVKVWKIATAKEDEEEEEETFDLDTTEVRELQILRDHTDYLSVIKVHQGTVYSSCSDGQIYAHTFPDTSVSTHYDMAVDADEDTAAAVMLDKKGGAVMAKPDQATELCLGPGKCQTGKTGLVKSSSSFQVSFSLKPTVCSVGCRVKLPLIVKPQTVIEEDDEEWDPDSDTDEYTSDEYTDDDSN